MVPHSASEPVRALLLPKRFNQSGQDCQQAAPTGGSRSLQITALALQDICLGKVLHANSQDGCLGKVSLSGRLRKTAWVKFVPIMHAAVEDLQRTQTLTMTD